MTADEAQILSAQIAQKNYYLTIIQTGIALLTVLASLAVSFILYRGTRRIALAEYRRSMRDGWASINMTALSATEMLETADLLLDPTLVGIPDAVRRRKWFAYMLLNSLASMYYGIQHGFVEAGTLERVERMVSVLAQDNEVFELTQRDIFEPGFSNLCKKHRKNPCH